MNPKEIASVKVGETAENKGVLSVRDLPHSEIFNFPIALDSKGVYSRHFLSLVKYAFHRSAKRGLALGLTIPDMTEIARQVMTQIVNNKG